MSLNLALLSFATPCRCKIEFFMVDAMAISQEEIKTRERERGQAYVGLIPPPELLAEYERLLPGTSEHLFRIIEQEQLHRLQLQKEAIADEKSIIKFGQIVSLLIIVGSVAAGAFVSIRGAEVAGAIMGGLGILAPLGVFMKYRWRMSEIEEQFDSEVRTKKFLK